MLPTITGKSFPPSKAETTRTALTLLLTLILCSVHKKPVAMTEAIPRPRKAVPTHRTV